MISPSMKQLQCTFHSCPFAFQDDTIAHCCQTIYHPTCICVGVPFTTRLRKAEGLSFPNVSEWAISICEACTVRSVLDRELTWTAPDRSLLMLERMRLIAMSSKWATGTHSQYQGKLQQLQEFGTKFGVSLLQPTHLEQPPTMDAIPLMWAHEYESIQPVGRSATDATKTFSSLRGDWSAASQFHAWDIMVSHPASATMESPQQTRWLSTILPLV
jgi:hypothetical protein